MPVSHSFLLMWLKLWPKLLVHTNKLTSQRGRKWALFCYITSTLDFKDKMTIAIPGKGRMDKAKMSIFFPLVCTDWKLFFSFFILATSHQLYDTWSGEERGRLIKWIKKYICYAIYKKPQNGLIRDFILFKNFWVIPKSFLKTIWITLSKTKCVNLPRGKKKPRRDTKLMTPVMCLKRHYLRTLTASFISDMLSSSSKQLYFSISQTEKSSVDAV